MDSKLVHKILLRSIISDAQSDIACPDDLHVNRKSPVPVICHGKTLLDMLRIA